ncbi:RND family transporter [Haloferula sp. A504]|uniref:RND family transporter n=1 Tax=Haloferula sp. A504 TaxID=3373601 RepID=UPI0031C39F71|nr:MMPL family transporter [Verrucomicrobiaceae bacterium E54]
MQWLVERGRVPFLILIGAVTLLLAFRCLHLEVDRDNRSMDADNAGQALLEARFRENFDEGESILVAVRHPDLLGDGGRSALRRMVAELGALEGVRRVTSLADTDFVVLPHQVGLLISKDQSVTAIRLVLHEFSDNGETLARLVRELERITDAHADDFTRIAITGLPIQKYEVGRLVRRDQRMFAPLSLLVLGTVLFAITRRLSGMLFPLLVSVLTICWTLGVYSWTGHSLNMITSLLPPVIMTLSVATSIHIYIEWLGSRETDRVKRITGAVRTLYKPCLFATLTTAIGFLSLLLSSTPAVRHFGLFAALGVVVSLLLGVAGLAVGLGFLVPPVSDRLHGNRGWGFFDRMLQAVSGLSVNHPWKVVVVALGVAAVGVSGLQRIRTDTDLLHFLGGDSRLVSDTEFIDGHLAGASAIELLVECADGSAVEDLGPITDFEDRVRRIPHVRAVTGIADLLPEFAMTLLERGTPLSKVLADFEGNPFLTKDRAKLRITVSTDLIGTEKGEQVVDAIGRMAGESLGGAYKVIPVGGFYRVITESNQLVDSQLRSFGVAIVCDLLVLPSFLRLASPREANHQHEYP